MQIITNIPPQQAAQIALSNRLYVSGWLLNADLHHIVSGDVPANMSLAIINNEVVGVAIQKTGDSCYYNISVFVKHSHRRKGIGTALIGALPLGEDARAGYGIQGSEKFWNKLQINWS